MPADALYSFGKYLPGPVSHLRWGLDPWDVKNHDGVAGTALMPHNWGGGNLATSRRGKIWTRRRGWQER